MPDLSATATAHDAANAAYQSAEDAYGATITARERVGLLASRAQFDPGARDELVQIVAAYRGGRPIEDGRRAGAEFAYQLAAATADARKAMDDAHRATVDTRTALDAARQVAAEEERAAEDATRAALDAAREERRRAEATIAAWLSRPGAVDSLRRAIADDSLESAMLGASIVTGRPIQIEHTKP
jgi:hypothetical protein